MSGPLDTNLSTRWKRMRRFGRLRRSRFRRVSQLDLSSTATHAIAPLPDSPFGITPDAPRDVERGRAVSKPDLRNSACCRFAWFATIFVLIQACLGCANLWDEITDHNFEMSQLWNKPNPYLVLKESSDGTKRAKAFRTLHEPSQNGGSSADQDTIVKILTAAAVTEHTAVARMAAIETLGKFKDPRAADALIAAYYAADRYKTAAGDTVKYSADMAGMLRCQSLQALGQQGDPKAVQHLVTVMRQPPVRGAEADKQMVMDERIAAARALAKFHDPRAEEALLDILRTEKDIALKDCAHESLQVATGKKYPQESPEWDSLVNPAPRSEAVASEQKPQVQPVQPASFRSGIHPDSQTVQPSVNGSPVVPR